MGVVTVAALHLVPAHWVARALMHLHLLFTVTAGASGVLLLLVQNWILSNVNLVTAYAAHLFEVMGACMPAHALGILVTAHADGVLRVDTGQRVCTEVQHRLFTAAVVFALRTVAGFTLKSSHGAVTVLTAVNAIENRHDFVVFLMAHKAAIGAFLGVEALLKLVSQGIHYLLLGLIAPWLGLKAEAGADD